MVMVFAGGHISGAHYNPAVSLAMVIRRKMKISEMFFYWIAQLMGGFLGALTSHVITGKHESTVMEPALNITSSMPLLAELLGTFALTYVVLNVATAKDNAGNSFYGLAIGFTVMAMAVGHWRHIWRSIQSCCRYRQISSQSCDWFRHQYWQCLDLHYRTSCRSNSCSLYF
jgi:glycerol uptake facilitator-like aquaporin